MHRFKKVFTFTIAGLGVLSFITALSPLALAQTTQTVQEPRCTIGLARITTLLEGVVTTTEAHTKTYTQWQDTIAATITRAADRGFDTGTLEVAQSEIDSKVKTFTEKASSYTAALTTVQNTACGESEEAYTTALTTARTALAEVRTATTETKAAFIDKAKPALTTYANWLLEQLNENPEQGPST